MRGAERLVEAFSEQEIKNALDDMKVNSPQVLMVLQ
jgi:hypothetical protein